MEYYLIYTNKKKWAAPSTFIMKKNFFPPHGTGQCRAI